MVAYSFHKRFVDPVIAGLEPGPWAPGMKRQTLRKPRQRHARKGERVQLYTGPRMKPRLIGVVLCEAVSRVVLDLVRVESVGIIPSEGAAQHLKTAAELDRFAVRDGFDSWADLRFHWMEALGLTAVDGVLIEWSPLPAAED